jgi:ActR/RegA family two-component response regulator
MSQNSRSPDAPPDRSGREGDDPSPQNQDLHALIIEDDLVSGLGLQIALTPLGFRTFAFASTPLQALEQARLRRPDLMTVDINLLQGDGPQAVREIESALGGLDVLYVTGAAQIAPTLNERDRSSLGLRSSNSRSLSRNRL